MSVLELLVSSVVDYAIFALDPDGDVVSWNAGAERVSGYTADEVFGRHLSTFYTQQDLDDGVAERELAIAVATGRCEHEGWCLRKDGTRFWANVVLAALRGDDGRLVGFGVVTRDLTERKRGEDSIRDSEERFRLLVSSVSDYAIFLLDVDGRVASWNRGAERLKGYRADEIIGRHFSEFYTEEDRRLRVPQSGLGVALEQGRWESEGWRVRKDGTRFWANVVITALRGDDGRLRGFAKVTRDLTDRKRSEDALRGVLEREREAAEQLRGVDRMRRELVTMVAHDLRGPISVVQNLLDLLLLQWDELDDHDRRARVDRARLRADVLAALADDIFDVALIDAGTLDVTPEAIDVGQVVTEVVEDADALADGRRAPVMAKIDDHAIARGDRRRTWQIVSNLVSNAAKFSPVDQPVEVTVRRAGDEVVVAVHDAGPGIPEPDQERVFDRFIRLRGASRVPGSGLGLFIARSLAEAQGGRIALDSDAGSGTTFSLHLPADGA